MEVLFKKVKWLVDTNGVQNNEYGVLRNIKNY